MSTALTSFAKFVSEAGRKNATKGLAAERGKGARKQVERVWGGGRRQIFGETVKQFGQDV